MSVGFSRHTFEFLQGLEANNSKDWFEANKAQFETNVKAPAFAIIDMLSAEMAQLEPPLKCEPRINGSLKRINRDVRFSKDKTPYNPRIHLVFWSGTHPNRSPAMHIVIGPQSIGYGAGLFGIEAPALERIRKCILDETDRSDLLDAIEMGEKVGCSMGQPDLKTMPRGYDVAEEWGYLLRHKAFVMRTRQDYPLPDWVSGNAVADEILSLTRACLPFIKWLDDRG
jgi:uncharacterized protein (TIGR02453 family)